MSFPRPLLGFALAAALLAGTAAQAAVAWDESSNGDLSNDGLAPSFAALVAGSNQLLGTTGRVMAGGAVDRDYLHFTVPAGHVLQSLQVLPGQVTLGGGAFIGLMAGPQFTVPPTTFSADGLLGWTLFGIDQEGTDILEIMSVPALGSSGFSIPLPAGDYSLWVQETSVGESVYKLDFVVAEVPEAPTALAMLGGLALLGAALRRR
jgi:hypothetical protein